VDAVVLGGDLADGPMPAQTLDRLEELGERAVWVRGNSDRWLADAFDGTFQPSGLPTNPPAAYFITGNIRASASDTEALAAFSETREHQARQRQDPA
jgi:3',5'-cyclic AMP phosphodiesterase CpdA